MLESEIETVAGDVWEAMFGHRLTPSAEAEEPGPCLTSIVHIDGAWQGAVTLRCPQSLAASLTDRVFGESTEPEIHDLLGELANQLGGNIKAMLPQPCSLSLPLVATGDDHEVRVLDTTVAARLALASEGTAIVITLLERRP